MRVRPEPAGGNPFFKKSPTFGMLREDPSQVARVKPPAGRSGIPSGKGVEITIIPTGLS